MKVLKKRDIFSTEKVVCSALEIITKGFSHYRQVLIKFLWIENSVSAIHHIGNREKKMRCFPPSGQAKVFAYSCRLTLHTSYTNGVLDQKGEGC